MSGGSLLRSGPPARFGTNRPLVLAVAVVLASLWLLGCGAPLVERSGGQSTQVTQNPDVEPAPGLDAGRRRSVTVSTSACGFSPDGSGSGLAISDGLVLTAAHVVSGSSEIRIERSNGGPSGAGAAAERTAEVIAYDTLRDLALLEVGPAPAGSASTAAPWPEPDTPRFRVLAAGQQGVILGAATSGDVAFTVDEKTIIEMDEVRGQRRSRRSGYLLDARTAPGDSGSGLYDSDGFLVGLLFAVSSGDLSRSWATAADEIESFLADESAAGTFVCNPDRSRLQRQG